MEELASEKKYIEKRANKGGEKQMFVVAYLCPFVCVGGWKSPRYDEELSKLLIHVRV